MGGGIHRLAIFSLSITPYISAAVILQLMAIVSQRLRALRNQGQHGRRVINQLTRYLTLLLAAAQAYGIAVGLAGVPGLVADPGWLFIVSTAFTLIGGTLFLVWLSEQITLRGIGNGIVLILFVSIVTELPGTIDRTQFLSRQGSLSNSLMGALVVIVVAVTGFVVLMERARRLLAIQYPKRQVGTCIVGDQSTHLPLKLNCAGIVPVILASWLLSMLIVLVDFTAAQGPAWSAIIVGRLKPGQPLYLMLYAVLIFFCAFFYTAFVIDPEEAAENLKKHRGSIPGIELGEATAEHIDYVISRTTVIGAGYLTLVCLLPEILIAYAAVPIYFGGTLLLLLVCAVLDLDEYARVNVLLKQRGSPAVRA